jgi:hypothetical protein
MMKETGSLPPASDEVEETGPSTEDSEETTSSELTMPKAVTKGQFNHRHQSINEDNSYEQTRFTKFYENFATPHVRLLNINNQHL